MTIVLDGTNGITTPDLESSGPVTGTTGTFSGNVTLGTSVLATPTGSAPSYTCRAWVNFNGTGTVAIRASGNVTSITDLGVGTYQVNFTTAMPDANYAGSFTQNNFVDTSLVFRTPLTTSVEAVIVKPGVDNYDASIVTVAIFR